MSDELTSLSVGCDTDYIGDSVQWEDEFNIKSYECVFLDFYSLEQKANRNSLSKRPNYPSESDILKSVAAGNSIYFLMPTSPYIRYNNYGFTPSSIIPGDIDLVDESGNYIDKKSISDIWEWYFKRHFDWKIRLDMQNHYFTMGERNFSCEYESLVNNPSDEALAWTIKYGQVIESPMPSGQPDIQRMHGDVTCIPVINGWDPSDIIVSILENQKGLPIKIDEDESPEWTSEWSLPGETEVRERAELIEQEINQKKESLENLRDEINEYQHYKSLLWGNEHILEQLVPQVFEEFGFEVEGEEPHGRDGLVHVDDICFVLEITGTVNDISDSKYRQLLGWVADAESEANDLDTEFVGLLVVNPRRKENPNSRNESEYLPTHLRRRMKQKGFKLLLTPTLYQILQEYRDDKLTQEDIHRLLMTDSLIIETP